MCIDDVNFMVLHGGVPDMMESCDKLATLIKDYRSGEIAAPDGAHVRQWIEQFSANVREPILTEMIHVFGKSYASRASVTQFLKAVVSSKKFAGDDPATFWKGVSFLRLQQAGNSQREMLDLVDVALNDAYGFASADCGNNPHTYVYLDDGVFSGGRIKGDLIRWIQHDAPVSAKVAVIVMAEHMGGSYFARTRIQKAANSAGKEIEVKIWHAIQIEDRRAYIENSDVLRPKVIPIEAQAYVNSFQYQPVLRTLANVGGKGFFSSGDARNLVEQEFLKGGIVVRDRCPLLPDQMRPLGCTLLQTTGFGTMFVTHRNIPNNAPLVLWAGDPWYPLFPRKTN